MIPGMRGGGGAERSLAAMAPFLSREIQLDVVTFTGRVQLRSELEAAGASLTDLAASNLAAKLTDLRGFIGDVRPDLVHTTLLDADIVGRMAAVTRRTPVVSSLVNVNHGLHRMRTQPGATWKRGVFWLADATTARVVVRFHALTEHVATTMSMRLGISRNRIDVIPRGRDPDRLGTRTAARRAAARRSLGFPERHLVIAAARHETQKGLDLLVRAAANVLAAESDVRFVIGGRDGAQTNCLHRLVDEMSLADHVSFIGQRDDVPELMCAADVWCVPSRWEGLGSILIEAMALEVPVVATRIEPIDEVAGNPPVFGLVPPQPAALASEIVALLRAPELAAERARAGRQRFLESFTAERVSTCMLDFYRTAYATSRLKGRQDG